MCYELCDSGRSRRNLIHACGVMISTHHHLSLFLVSLPSYTLVYNNNTLELDVKIWSHPGPVYST